MLNFHKFRFVSPTGIFGRSVYAQKEPQDIIQQLRFSLMNDIHRTVTVTICCDSSVIFIKGRYLGKKKIIEQGEVIIKSVLSCFRL